jgi:D-hexose-6-phosphate mutarotase
MVTIPHFLEVKVHEYKNFKLMRLKIDNLYYIEKINKVDTNKVDTNKVDTNKVDTNKVDTNKVDTNKVDINTDKIYKNCFFKF